MSFFSEGIEGFIREDDVIEKLDIEDVAGSLEPLRLVDVGGTRNSRPARVVVEEDDRGGVRHERLFDDPAVVDRGRLERPDGDHLLGQRELGRIEEEEPGLLVIEGPEVFPEEPSCLGRCGDGSVGCVVCLLFHSAAVLRVKHLSLRCGKRDTPAGHRQDKVENRVDLVGMSGYHNFAA